MRLIKLFYALLALMMMIAGCTTKPPGPSQPPQVSEQMAASASSIAPQASPAPEAREADAVAANDGAALIFRIDGTDGADGGVDRLIGLMGKNGVPFYKTAAASNGIIARDDVVLLEINCQWAERGGTNTDLIKSVVDAVIAHPEGFSGEVIVADNGQAQYGSARRGGSLDWDEANSKNRDQSVLDVVNGFTASGAKVSGVLWDDFTTVRVGEFSGGDSNDGFVVEDSIRDTGLEISYAKFTTEYGTRVSFKEGIWTGSGYDSDKLKVINMPVLKSHGLYQVTGAVKSYMGTTSDKLTKSRAHNSIGDGGMGTQMAYTRVPALNIMDMIFIGPERGPGVSYDSAVEKNMIAASLDPVAIDYWAAKHVLIPEAEKRPGGRAASMDPDGDTPGTFGYWLQLSMNELVKAGFNVTVDESKMRVITESGG